MAAAMNNKAAKYDKATNNRQRIGSRRARRRADAMRKRIRSHKWRMEVHRRARDSTEKMARAKERERVKRKRKEYERRVEP
jgi:hypothetical protein